MYYLKKNTSERIMNARVHCSDSICYGIETNAVNNWNEFDLFSVPVLRVG